MSPIKSLCILFASYPIYSLTKFIMKRKSKNFGSLTNTDEILPRYLTIDIFNFLSINEVFCSI